MEEIDYSKYVVKEYEHWEILVKTNQSYLGGCIVWCKREDALDYTDMTPEEHKEFLEILKKLRAATQHCFQADWFNYAFLGNETRHLHCHFVPRYKEPREFLGVMFTDKFWGHNYRTDHEFLVSEKLLQEVKNKLRHALDHTNLG